MNSKRIIFVFGSAFSAVALLVILLASLSSATAAQEISTPNVNNTEVTTADRWRILADMQYGRGDPGVVALNNKIHAISGFFSSGFGYPSSQEIYDPQTDTWSILWGFPNPRSDMVVVNAGNKIYAIGGWIDPDSQGDNHMYDPLLSQWFTKTSMTIPVSGAGGVVISDSIYVIGGYDSVTKSDTNYVQIYDTNTNSWTMGTQMSTSRSGLGAVLLNGLIYVIGGTYDTNDVEIYNPNTDTWSNGPSLPDTRFSMAVVERTGKIHVIGGTDVLYSGNVTNTNLILDPVSGTWSYGPPMPTARSAVDAAVISDTIYVIGGVGEPGAGTANEAFGDFVLLPSTTSIVLDVPDPSQAFQPVVISYTVNSSTGLPTGWVTVTAGQIPLQCSGQLAGGTGSCEITFVAPGTYTLTAVYSGDDFYSGSSDSESHVVVEADTSTSLLGHQPDPSLEGKPISVTFEVTSTYGLPVGPVTVTVSNSPETCTDDLANGVGGCVITLDALGTYTITAAYNGNAAFAPSSATATHVVVDILKVFIPFIQQE